MSKKPPSKYHDLKDPDNIRAPKGGHRVLSGSGLKVVCPGCRQTFHETSLLYKPNKKAHGAMFQLLPEFGPKGANWSSFAEHKDTEMGELFCPMCAHPYIDEETGFVTSVVVKKPYVVAEPAPPMEGPFECLICGKEFKRASGLATHMKTCGGK